MSKFSIGEIAGYAPEIGIGGECIIIELPRPRYLLGRMWHDLYLVEFAGKEMTTCELYLRKKKPPSEELSNWDNEVFDQLNWHPDRGVERV